MGEVLMLRGDSEGCWFILLPQPPVLVTVPAIISHDLLFSLRSMQAMPLIRDMQTHVSKKIQRLICISLGLTLIGDLLVFPVICQSLQ